MNLKAFLAFFSIINSYLGSLKICCTASTESFGEPETRILFEHRIDETSNPKDRFFAQEKISSELPNKTTKILNTGRPSPPIYNPIYGTKPVHNTNVDLSYSESTETEAVQHHPSVSSVEMQLLAAFEKLVKRIDSIDNRLKIIENKLATKQESDNKKIPSEVDREIQYQVQSNDCPNKFTKVNGIGRRCYFISSIAKSSTVSDWKTAAAECGKYGGRLAEITSFSDYYRIVATLTKFTNIRNGGATDFWTGGLNPGLIWIWAESGQKIDLDKRYWNENDNSSRVPGCLKLSYSLRLNTFFFKGAPCSQAQNFLCETLDNSVLRALDTLETVLNKEND